MKNIVIGITAHVDSGKTTLSEGLLFEAGTIDRIGRVDKQDAHLDTYSLERERGITIFSKQAIFDFQNTHITLIDTPGHIDFSCETERALSVIDYAVLLISAEDGVRAHTKTLWQLLSARHIPTFIFVNKIDISSRTRQEIQDELSTVLSKNCVNFSNCKSDEFFEEVASRDEKLMEKYFDCNILEDADITEAIRRRSVFPCFFGSALKMTGVKEFLVGLDRFTREPEYQKNLFGAKVYKIMRDQNGKRLTLAKITGGYIKPKDTVEFRDSENKVCEEKIEEIRVLSLGKSKPAKIATVGEIVALIGPTKIHAGSGLGIEPDESETLVPVLNYRMILEDGADVQGTYLKIQELSSLDPTLNLKYDEERREIRVSLMGEIQIEVLKELIFERFNVRCSFDEGEILYRETVKEEVIGCGHFEPLRHYAEVHLKIEPLEEGSGIVTDSECSVDSLALNWQRLILTNIKEKNHRGVKLGAPLTDVKITVIGGRAHPKHTEGGDFRQATYRAIRQGLMKASTVILEPTFNFRVELPKENLGRFMTDIENMSGTTSSPEFIDDLAILEGNCPVYTIRSYATTLRAYTKGQGKITFTSGAYKPCHNEEEVIAKRAYDAERDVRNTADSVFCKNGSGFEVKWWEADSFMHIPIQNEHTPPDEISAVPLRAKAKFYRGTAEEDKELISIFEQTYGKIKPRKVSQKTENTAKVEAPQKRPKKVSSKLDEYVIVDGYNVIFGWADLNKTSKNDLPLAREMLVRIMCNYSSYHRCKVIVVFDAYKQKGNEGSLEKYGNVTVIYTKERQTADSFIEKATYEIAPSNLVRVVTSDLQEQYIILGNGALRVSTKEFQKEVELTTDEINKTIDNYKYRKPNNF